MMKMFKMTNLELLHYYLGMDVRQEKKGFILSQESYARKILEKEGMT
jgi:hypothetical protein